MSDSEPTFLAPVGVLSIRMFFDYQAGLSGFAIECENGELVGSICLPEQLMQTLEECLSVIAIGVSRLRK